MLHIERTLPGEFDGTVRPEDYGFGVIREDPLDAWESDERVAELYQRAVDRTGVRIPALELVLARVATRQQVLD